MPDDDGVRLRAVEGRRSSQHVGREVFASAAEPVDSHVAAAIRDEPDWRKRYPIHVRRLVEAGVRSADRALTGARRGLEALHGHLELVRGGDARPIRDALSLAPSSGLRTAEVRGRADGRPELTIPRRGDALRGDRIRRQLDRWVEAGTIEPSCGEAVEKVLANPDWLDLSDRRFLLLGAASEMGPLEALSSWGATTIAIDVPRADLWGRIVSVARAGRGRLLAPVRAAVTDEADLPAAAGADLLTQAPEIRAWVGGLDGPLTIDDSTYADGTTFLLLAGVTDALIADLVREHADVSLGYLATPTDVFAVPEEVVTAARRRPVRRWLAPARAGMRGITAGRLYRPNYREAVTGEDGRRWGVADCLVPQQGPNYALAKNAQRWRATAELAKGTVVSANVAPPTRTRSVMKNRLLAAAYGGAGAFGVEVFEPATSRWLMAALLVHDLRNPPVPTTASSRHPYDLFVDGAAHGGIWRLRHEPRSVLPLAVARGLARRRR